MKKICIMLCLLSVLFLASCQAGNDKELFLPDATNDKIFTVLDDKESEKLTCTLEVRCDDALSSPLLPDEKRAYLPADGAIIAKCEVEFSEGESVFDVLLRETQARKIHFDFSETPAYNSTYIKGISNLYELDCGEFSGWLYYVNGESPDVGYSQYEVKDGDSIAWTYTCDWRETYGE